MSNLYNLHIRSLYSGYVVFVRFFSRIFQILTNSLDFYFHITISVTEVKPNEEYTVGFVSDERLFKLNVYLGLNFPNEKPKIVVVPRIQHDWISDPSTGEIQTAPGLLNVSATHICSKIY